MSDTDPKKKRFRSVSEVAAEQARHPEEAHRERKVERRHHWEKRRRNDHDEGQLRIRRGWKIVGFALLLFAVVALGIFGWLHIGEGKVETVVSPEVEAKIKASLAKREKFDVDRTKVDQQIMAFLDADGIEERLQFVRNPERVKPLMEKYYEKRDPGPIPYESGQLRVQPVQEAYIGEHLFLMTAVYLKGFVSANLVLESVDDTISVDWESFVGFSEMSLETFLSEQPQTPTLMRLIGFKEQYYNYDFEDVEKYGCLRLESEDGSYRLYSYVERSSETARRLDRAFKSRESSQGIHVVVKIRYPETIRNDRQVILDEILSNSWVDIEGRSLDAPKY